MTHNLPPTVGSITSADPLPDELEDSDDTIVAPAAAAAAVPATAATTPTPPAAADAPTIATIPAAPLDFTDPAVQVILHVQRTKDDIHMRLFVDGKPQSSRTLTASRAPSSQGHGLTGVSLARSLSEAQKIKSLLNQLRDVAKATTDPWMCIDEVGESGIPWELMPYDLDEMRPLGIDFITWRRYQDLDDNDLAAPVQWGLRPVRGDVVSFCSEDVRPYWPAGGHAATAGTFPELHAALGTSRAGTALVYVLCHFVLSAKSRFGLKEKHDDAIDADFLNLRNLRLLREVKPIVFVNACGTNQVLPREPYLHDTQPPLHDRFRARGATGVIGTFDIVEVNSAAATGERIIELARTRRLRVPELLRELRREVHAALDPFDLTAETAARYFHAFAYVYLGAPGAYLVLE